MHFSQPRAKVPLNSHRPSLPTHCQIYMNQQQIHRYPLNIRRSVKLQQHRFRPNIHRKSNLINQNIQILKNVEVQLNAQLNMGSIMNENRMLIVEDYRNEQPPIKMPEEFQNTADRMMSMRRRLAPVKKVKDGRTVNSVDKMRQGPVNRATFLNIEKCQLVKISSERERNQIYRHAETATDRSIETTETSHVYSPTLDFKCFQTPKELTDIKISDLVVNMRKSMKETTNISNKWHTNRPRVRPFVAPFERYYYKDFIWKVALTNGILMTVPPEQTKFKVFIGRGNNSQLIRSLIKRRSWWTFTQKWEDAHFVWTQLKYNDYINSLPPSDSYLAQRQSLPKQTILRNESVVSMMNSNDILVWDKYWRQFRTSQLKLGQDMNKRNLYFKKLSSLTQVNTKTVKMHNHFSQNFIIGNKKALLYTMKQYYQSNDENVFDYLPLSFHLRRGVDDPEYSKFLGLYYQRRKRSKKDGSNNVWIVKPGELTNRGNGIIVCLTLQQIKSILKKGGKHFDGTPKTFIVQEYIQKPLLYMKRKFDIRHFILITSINGRFKGYWFKRGYIRTSSSQYTLTHGQANVHLTNDAVQKNLPDYGKFQKGNKVSYEDFQAYLNKEYQGKYDFWGEIFPKMKKMATDTIKASARALDAQNRQQTFELFGLDFMIDEEFNPWLIECNTNPCLQVSCPLQKNMIPALIQNILRLAVDPIFSPPADFSQKRPRFTDNALTSNQFQLVYDSVLQERDLHGAAALSSDLNFAQLNQQQDQEFEDDGEALED